MSETVTERLDRLERKIEELERALRRSVRVDEAPPVVLPPQPWAAPEVPPQRSRIWMSAPGVMPHVVEMPTAPVCFGGGMMPVVRT